MKLQTSYLVLILTALVIYQKSTATTIVISPGSQYEETFTSPVDFEQIEHDIEEFCDSMDPLLEPASCLKTKSIKTCQEEYENDKELMSYFFQLSYSKNPITQSFFYEFIYFCSLSMIDDPCFTKTITSTDIENSENVPDMQDWALCQEQRERESQDCFVETFFSANDRYCQRKPIFKLEEESTR